MSKVNVELQKTSKAKALMMRNPVS